jgi:DNA-directed RNA polymerase subunit RPC12/RpoP
MATNYPQGEVDCVCKSGIKTRLRCSRCGKPICYECMVESPVGYRCPDCSSGPRVSAYRTTNALLARATGVGLVVAAAIGFLWGNFPSWNFYMALLLGFGTVEAMARAGNDKRGSELQIAAFGAVAIGLIVSRYTIAMVNPENFPIDLTFQLLRDNPDQDIIRRVFYLRIIPDFLFMAIPFAIAYIRFR